MPKLKMTDIAVRQTTAAPGERIDLFDAHPRDRQRGLVLRVSGSVDAEGKERVTRTWAIFTRVAGNPKLRLFTIGQYPAFSLAEAREAGGEIWKLASQGIDPLAKRRAEAEEKRSKERDTVESLVEDFLDALKRRPKKKGGKRSPRYVAEVKGNFDRHVLPRWKDRSIHSITRRDVTDLLDAVADGGTVSKGPDGEKRKSEGGPIASNRVLSALSGFFSWAVKKGVIGSTPAAQLDKRGEEVERERFLDDGEIQALWPEFIKRGYPFAHFYRLLLLTAQRRDEVAGMRWDEIDFKEKIWTIPTHRAKARRPHVVPLSESALAILADAKKEAEAIAKALEKTAGPYVLSTTAETPISGYSRNKGKLDRDVSAARKKQRSSPIPGWRVHDLRRTASTAMTKLGIPEFVVARILNHARQGQTKVYDRNSYLTEKRHALDLWAARLKDLTSPPAAANVVPIRGRRRG